MGDFFSGEDRVRRNPRHPTRSSAPTRRFQVKDFASLSDPIPFHEIPIQFQSQARLLRHLDIAFHYS